MLEELKKANLQLDGKIEILMGLKHKFDILREKWQYYINQKIVNAEYGETTQILSLIDDKDVDNLAPALNRMQKELNELERKLGRYNALSSRYEGWKKKWTVSFNISDIHVSYPQSLIIEERLKNVDIDRIEKLLDQMENEMIQKIQDKNELANLDARYQGLYSRWKFLINKGYIESGYPRNDEIIKLFGNERNEEISPVLDKMEKALQKLEQGMNMKGVLRSRYEELKRRWDMRWRPLRRTTLPSGQDGRPLRFWTTW